MIVWYFKNVEFLVSSDGACGFNCGAAHLFQDPKYGPPLRKVINAHIINNWQFYQNKIDFPYKRQIGVSGETICFNTGQEKQFL